MGFFEKMYTVKDWHGNAHSLTANALYKRVLEDSKSDYNYWIASATELVKVCNDPHFPVEYTVAIKMFILNYFASLELHKEYPSHREATDKAVYHCYNSLSNDIAKQVKDKYLAAVITGITIGATYRQKVEEWKKAKFDEYVSATEIDFDQLREDLYADFDRMVKTTE